MPRLKAILFDLDGTLIDSETMHFHCWNELLSPYKIKLEHDHYLRAFAGVSVNQNAQYLIDLYKIDSTSHELAEQRKQIYLNKLDVASIGLMPHAAQTVNFFYEKKVQLGLVTSSSRREVDAVLKNCDLGKYFASVVTRDDVVNHKPHPEPYRKIMNRLGVQYNECLAVEDTVTGASSAKAAGLTCFAIQVYPPEVQKLTGIADLIFSNLDEVKNYLMTKKGFDI